MSAVLECPAPVLRPMEASDVRAVMAIERAAYRFPWSPGIFHDCLRVGYCCWVLEEREHLLGYAIMSVGAGESHILNLCVHEEHRRRGLGNRLLLHLLDLARAHNADVTLLEVRPSNVGALAMYHRAGFNEVGVRRAYYPMGNGREDALILALQHT